MRAGGLPKSGQTSRTRRVSSSVDTFPKVMSDDQSSERVLLTRLTLTRWIDWPYALREQETAAMFQHLDANGDGTIDLAEFTRFCLEVRALRQGRTDRRLHPTPYFLRLVHDQIFPRSIVRLLEAVRVRSMFTA